MRLRADGLHIKSTSLDRSGWVVLSRLNAFSPIGLARSYLKFVKELIHNRTCIYVHFALPVAERPELDSFKMERSLSRPRNDFLFLAAADLQ